ncbi:MAG: hypothetical protein IKO93_09625 [Lentisphaeria bacterium]|nr:hypothetical protein [Lentisphaeria bacterium]
MKIIPIIFKILCNRAVFFVSFGYNRYFGYLWLSAKAEDAAGTRFDLSERCAIISIVAGKVQHFLKRKTGVGPDLGIMVDF